ncbi:hypothetical protein Tco_0588184, partial [Tanacetum coccineum]
STPSMGRNKKKTTPEKKTPPEKKTKTSEKKTVSQGRKKDGEEQDRESLRLESEEKRKRDLEREAARALQKLR